MADQVTLRIDDQDWGGWESVRIMQSMTAVSRAFELSLTDRWPGQTSYQPIAPGKSVEVRINGERVVSGWIDSVSPSYSPRDHTISVAGRDKTADLVDCSAMNDPGQWRGARLNEIISDLLKPFGIGLMVQTDLGKPFDEFSIDKGETAFESLERLCRMRAVLATTDGSGNVVLTRGGAGGSMGVELRRGENILQASASFDHRDRGHEYIVRAQLPPTIDYFNQGKTEHALEARVNDAGVRRHRPMLIMAEQAADQQAVADRARWEAVVRAARARTATITVQGWSAGSKLWTPNTTVVVRDDWLGLDQTMIIAGATFEKSASGTRTTLELQPPGAYELLPELPKPEKEELSWID
ncbi:MAG: phage baseplate assembly protein [Pseudomonadota bacterium]